MAITSSSGDGVRFTSAAKESAGNASVLGSPASSASNNIIVPDAIGSNNEGNLESTPSYVGRMLALRPWEIKLQAATILDGGSGYAVSDVLTLSGGVSGPGGSPQVTVEAVSGGVITEISISREAGFELRGGAQTSAPSPPYQDNSPLGVSVTGGTGSGARFTCTFRPHWELRYITADASNTLTVHEDWDIPPVSGDNWAVAYTLDDGATANGITLRAQSGVFEATRLIKIGPSPDSTRRGWLALNDGKALELDNATSVNFFLADGGMFTCGYLSNGIPVNGGYITTSGTSAADFWLGSSTVDGAGWYIYDLQLRSPRSEIEIRGSNTVPDLSVQLWRECLDTVIQESGFFDGNPINLGANNNAIHDVVFSFGGSSLPGATTISMTQHGTPRQTFADMNGVAVVNSDLVGFTNTLTKNYLSISATFSGLRNIRFITCNVHVTPDDNETWEFVNPSWTSRDLGAAGKGGFIDWARDGIGNSQILEFFSLIVRPTDIDGNPVSDLSGYVYEGQFTDTLLEHNTERSLSSAYLGASTDSRWRWEVEVGDVYYGSDVIRYRYTAFINSSPLYQTAVEEYGDWAFRGYKYGFVPVLIPLVPVDGEGIDIQSAVLEDSFVTAASASAALIQSPPPKIEKHDPNNPIIIPTSPLLDEARMIAFNYDGGNGSGGGPGIGDSVTVTTKSPQATGTVADHIGDGVTGTLLLEFWNEIDFLDNEALTSGAWTGTVNRNQSPEFYETYARLVYGSNLSETELYDWFAAKIAEDPADSTFLEVIRWAGSTEGAANLVQRDSGGIYTVRTIGNGPQDYILDTLFIDDFNRSPNENPITGVGSPQPWTTNSGSPTINGAQMVTVVPPSGGIALGNIVSIINEDYINFGDDQYAEAQLAGVFTNTNRGGPACRLDPVKGNYGYALIFVENATTGQERYELVRFDGSFELQQVTVLASVYSSFFRSPPFAPSTLYSPIEFPIMRILCQGTTIRGELYDPINGELVYSMSAQDDTYSSGQPGVIGISISGSAVRLDNFEAGEARLVGEGVWIKERGAGTFNYLTSDSGQVFTIPVQLTITLIGLVETSEVAVCLTGTQTEVASIENVGSPTDFSFNIDSGVAVDIIIHAITYEHIRIENISFSGDASIPISQRFDRNYSNP